MGAVFVVGFQSQGGVLAVFGGLDTIVADPRTRRVIKRRNSFIDGDGAARSQSRSAALLTDVGGAGVVLAQDRRFGTGG